MLLANAKKILVLFFVCLFLLGTVPGTRAQGIDDSSAAGKQSGLTIEDAVEKAIIHSRSIKQAKLDIDRSEEVRKSLSEKVNFIPLETTSAIADQAYTTLVASDIALGMAKKAKTLEEDKVVYSVLQEYTNVLKAIDNLNYALKNLSDAQWQWNIGRLSYTQGVIASMDKDGVEGQHNIAISSKQLAEIELNKAYTALNKLLGFAPEERPLLIEQPGYSILEAEDAEAEAYRIISANPAVWLADQQINLAEVELSLYQWNTAAIDPYKAKAIDVEKSTIAAGDIREQIKLQVMLLYDSIKQLERNYCNQQEMIKIAEEGLRVTRLKQEIGMATKSDVQQAELHLAKLEKELNELVYQHEVLKYGLQKPWAMY